MAKLVFDEEVVRNCINAVKKASGFPNASMTLKEATDYANSIDPVYSIGSVAIFDEDPGEDWVLLDGRVLNISDYPVLAEYFKMVYGGSNYFGGDGVETFDIWKGYGLVPALTSNTSPYGKASALSSWYYQGTWDAWCAFRAPHNDLSDGFRSESLYAWSPSNNSAKTSWVQYEFPNPICLKKFECIFGSDASMTYTYNVSGSNDGTTFEQISEDYTLPIVQSVPSGVLSHNVDNDKYYKIIRLTLTGTSGLSVNGSYTGGFTRAQFYGKELAYIKAKEA